MSGPVNPKAAPGEEMSGNAKTSGKRAKARALDAFSRITLDEFEDELRGYRRPQAETALFGGFEDAQLLRRREPSPRLRRHALE